MNLNKHSKVTGQHAFLSPSTYHWLDYDEDKLRASYFAKKQSKRGDDLHALARNLIDLDVKLPDNGTTLSMYVNDAIGYRMQAEVPLYYSDDCFGTADAIGFREHRDILTLRVHDLKTGISPTSMKQLLIYAAIFCFEYGFTPDKLHFILRIYQNDAIEEYLPDPVEILSVMSKIRFQAAYIAQLREED